VIASGDPSKPVGEAKSVATTTPPLYPMFTLGAFNCVCTQRPMGNNGCGDCCVAVGKMVPSIPGQRLGLSAVDCNVVNATCVDPKTAKTGAFRARESPSSLWLPNFNSTSNSGFFCGLANPESTRILHAGTSNACYLYAYTCCS
jgi:hypothetical protein